MAETQSNAMGQNATFVTVNDAGALNSQWQIELFCQLSRSVFLHDFAVGIGIAEVWSGIDGAVFVEDRFLSQ